MKYQLNMEKLVEHFGGKEALVTEYNKIHKRAGFKRLSINTVISWIRENKADPDRGTSVKRLLELGCLADELGIGFDIWEFCDVKQVRGK